MPPTCGASLGRRSLHVRNELGNLAHSIAIPIAVPNRIEKGAGEECMACALNLIAVLAGATLSSIKSFFPTGSQCSLTQWLCKHTQSSSNLFFDQLRTSKLCSAFSEEQMLAT